MSYISDLENKIVNFAKKYYTGNPEISDYEFDELVDELRSLKPDSYVLNTVGWGSGIDLSNGKKTEHKYQLIGSLNKVKEVDNIPYKTNIVISAKLDGLSAVCYYEDSKLVKAVTRGNGKEGIDITDKIIKILKFKTSISVDKHFTGAIRGELIISNDNWKIMKEKDSSLKNQRNTVSGIINRNDITDDIRFIDFIPYNIIGYELTKAKNTEITIPQSDIYKFLEYEFDNVCPHIFNTEDFDYEYLKELYDIYCKIYPCDGLVIGNNNVLIDCATYAIEYKQIAFKFPAEIKETEVIGINWNSTRTGKLVPVIRVKEVELSGASVNNVTGYNMKFIRDNKICTGAIIGINRSNEVIPCFKYLVSSPNIDEIPKVCPVCGSELEEIGVDLVCSNPECSNKNYRDLQCWVDNIGRVDGIASTLKFKFMDELGYTCIDDLYNKEFTALWTRGTHKMLFSKVMNKLLEEPVEVVDALCALNIPRLGSCSAKKLASNKSLIDCLIRFACDNITTNINELEYDISKLVGQATASSIMNNLNKVENLKYVRDRLVYPEISNNSDMVKVAITGKLSVKRDEFIKILNQNGFSISSINKDCKYLITDSPDSGSSKNQLADKLGIQKISEEEFRLRFIRS